MLKAVLPALLLVITTSNASAALLSFACKTPTNNANCAAVASQMQLDVTDLGGNQVKFRFDNLGPVASSIAQITWDDDAGLMTSWVSLTGGAGVAFTIDPSPDQPEAGGAFFSASDANFQGNANNPAPTWGVGPGEYLEAVFNYTGTFANLFAQFGTGGPNRVGMHVTSIAPANNSDFLYTDGSTRVVDEVPEPSTYLLMGAGLLGLGLLRKRSA